MISILILDGHVREVKTEMGTAAIPIF